MKFVVTFFVIYLGMLFSCSQETPPVEESLKLNSELQTQSIVAQHPLTGLDSGFWLDFSLEGPEAFLHFVAYADARLEGGIDLIFRKSADQMVVQIGDHQQALLPYASGRFQFYIEVHNSESPTHFLIWPGQDKLSEETSLFNSDSDLDWKKRGKGRMWGLHFQNAQVFAAQRTQAKVEHD